MITAVIDHGHNTLVLQLPVSLMDLRLKLVSIGIRNASKTTRLKQRTVPLQSRSGTAAVITSSPTVTSWMNISNSKTK